MPLIRSLTGHEPILRAILALALALFVVGCATTQQQSATTSAEFSQVFDAARQALQENGYAITAADSNSGFLSAAQYAYGGPGREVRANVNVKKGTPTTIEIAIIPPPGSIGDSSAIAGNIFSAIRKRIPDLAYSAPAAGGAPFFGTKPAEAPRPAAPATDQPAAAPTATAAPSAAPTPQGAAATPPKAEPQTATTAPLTSKEAVARAQARLRVLGYDAGPPDGAVGPKTLSAIRRFQADKGLKVSGQLDPETVRALGI